jgi:RNA polymerase sigma factor (sigma-70 family)
MRTLEQSDTAALRLAPLVQAAAAGDARAFGRLVVETQGVVCAICLAVTRDPTTSEDVAQQVFFDAWRGIKKLRAATSFLPWLRALARNHARMAVRTASRLRARMVAMDATHETLTTSADPSPNALTTLLNTEAREALTSALDAVPDNAREVLVLYYREGQSVRQVAELLGVQEATVKQRLTRARRTLRAEYLARVGELLDQSAPGAAFTALVTAGLATAALVASPGVAAAAVLSKGVAAGGSASLSSAATTGKGAMGAATLLSASGTGLMGGLGGGLLGLFAGTRALWREADSAEEQAAVRRYALSALAATLAFTAVLVTEAARSAGARPLPITLAGVVMEATFLWHHVWALPRARAPRVARDHLRDPQGTDARERRRVRISWAGFLFGTLGGAAPIVWLWL